MISDALLKLIEMQAKLAGGLSLQTIQMLLRLWSPFRDWTDYDLGVAQAARSATTVEAAMKAARQRERAYLKHVYKEMRLEMPTDEEINTDGGRLIIPGSVEIYFREGVTPLEVYQRPLEEFRYWKSTGLGDRESMVKMQERVSTIADTDITLSRREEDRRVFNNTPDVTGYRRIIHPELSEDGTSCGLCVVASQRLYHSDKLMPIHNECNCSVLPVTADQDPGKELNADDLERLYEAAALAADKNAEPGAQSNTAKDLLSTKVSFTEHGELGPIISTGNRAGSKQRKAAKDRSPLTPEESISKELHTLLKSADKLAVRAGKGEDVRKYLSWQRDRISILERRLSALRRNQ
jgi:hypothetical protein